MTELLIAKDKELKDTLTLAGEQAVIDQKMNALKIEVDRQDQDINQLQRQLKEAEQILSTAIYQAKQKLASISRANKRPVSSEELIKFAHRISASNAVCAPLTWQQGDPRRPYPTDIEMRLGVLGRLSELPANGHLLQQQSSLSDLHRMGHPPGGKYITFSVVGRILQAIFLLSRNSSVSAKSICVASIWGDTYDGWRARKCSHGYQKS